MKRRQILIGAGVLAAVPVAVSVDYLMAEDEGGAKTMDPRIQSLQDDWKSLLPADAQVATSTDPLELSEEQWRERLDDQAFNILREAGTERPNSSPLNAESRPGVFVCKGCDLPLFTSQMMFGSGTGWPSFITAIPNHLETQPDYKLVLPRTEYHCVKCGGHQGHLFDDGPPPTGDRWCNNGAALRFIPA
jgi:peptide-methionine (R)-S-oxide reductase